MATSIVGLGNKCIDIQAGNTVPGTPLVLWEQHGGSNQKWNFTIDNMIESAFDPSKCIDIAGGVPNVGARLVLNNKTGANSQKWQLDAQGRFISFADQNMCISAGGALQVSGNVTLGYHIALWRKNDPQDKGQIWTINIITAAVVQINLSYKVLAHPVTGAFPRPNMIANIQSAVQQMNTLCVNLNTSFRFRFLEQPILIGGPNASGQVNFWYNTWIHGEHMKPFETSAKILPGDFAWRENAINIYFTGSGWGGISSIPGNGDLVALAIDADLGGVHLHIHEFGHYFGLGHTMGDDGIVDTLVDNEGWNQNDIAMNNFKLPYVSLSLQQQKQVDNVWRNIMSYHAQPGNPLSVLTVNQLQKWDKIMRNQRANVIQP